MDIEEFFEVAKASNLRIQLDEVKTVRSHRLSNEALFHLPFISMVVLLMAKERRKPNTPELGQLVGECIERSIKEFKGSSQHLGVSAQYSACLTVRRSLALVNIPR